MMIALLASIGLPAAGATLAEQQKLTASDAAFFDFFGASVAVSGDTAVVGSPADGDGSGSAYVFTRDGLGVWTEQHKLTASDAAADDQFGFSVAVSGDTVVVGSPGDDDAGPGSASGSAYVFGLNEPPDCSVAAATPDTLWPPNHRMEPVEIGGVTDPDGDPVAITVDSIRQDEPVNDKADGNTAPDGTGVGTDSPEIRAERAGTGNGRVYHIGFTASDGQGGTCTGEVTVGVPTSQGKKGGPVDDGPLYDSTTA